MSFQYNMILWFILNRRILYFHQEAVPIVGNKLACFVNIFNCRWSYSSDLTQLTSQCTNTTFMLIMTISPQLWAHTHRHTNTHHDVKPTMHTHTHTPCTHTSRNHNVVTLTTYSHSLWTHSLYVVTNTLCSQLICKHTHLEVTHTMNSHTLCGHTCY